MSGHIPEDAERCLLGTILAFPEVLWTASSRLRPTDFGWTVGRIVFEAMADSAARHERVSVVGLSEAMRRAGTLESVGGASFLSQLGDAAFTAEGIESVIQAIVDASALRQLEQFGLQTAARARGSVPDVGALMADLGDRFHRIARRCDPNQPQPIGPILRQVLEDISEASTRAGLVGLPTGFRELDRATGGLHAGELTILGARPNMGKSALAATIAANVAAIGSAVGVFSLEMGSRQIGARLLSLTTGVSLTRYRRGLMDDAAWDATVAAADRMYNWPLFIDQSSGLTPAALHAKARALRHEHDVKLIIVDYLGLMRVDGSRDMNREREVATISQSLKRLAMDLDIPVLALSQLSRAVERAERKTKKPELADLRDSGSLEQDADVVLFLYRDEYYDPNSALRGIAEVMVAKQRQGERDVSVKLGFTPQLTRFYELPDEDRDVAA